MRDFKVGDRIRYRVTKSDFWKEGTVRELEDEEKFRVTNDVNDELRTLFQPSYCVRYNIVGRVEDFFILLSEGKQTKVVNCTCTNRAIFHFGCPSARGLPCRNGTE